MRNSQVLFASVLAAINNTVDCGAHIHGIRELCQPPIPIHGVGAQQAIHARIARVIRAIHRTR